MGASMADLIGSFVGAILVMFFLSRLTLGAFRKVGDNLGHIFLAHAVALAFAAIIYAAGFPADPPVVFYPIATALWVVVDHLALKGRRAKARVSNQRGTQGQKLERLFKLIALIGSVPVAVLAAVYQPRYWWLMIGLVVLVILTSMDVLWPPRNPGTH
jgi:hypothetical protein